MKVKTDYDGCRYITAGKEYEFYPDSSADVAGEVVNDDGEKIYILIRGCAHLDDHVWVMIEGDGQ